MLRRLTSITLVHLLLWMPLAACGSGDATGESPTAGAAGNDSRAAAIPGASTAGAAATPSSTQPSATADWSVPYRGEAPASHQTARANLDAFFELMEQIRGTLDRSQFDLEAQLDALDWDENSAIEAVTTRIAFQPYQGLLRGAVGTLMSRAGNALDQAVLLATLIKDAGFEARIAHGTLSAGDARRLVGLTAPAPPEPPFADASALDPLVAGYASFGETRPLTETAAWAGATAASRQISADLAGAGIRLEPADVTAELVAEVSDYYWVEYRLGPSDSWQAAHPAFGSGDPPTVTGASYLAERIPDDLQHRVRIEMFIEQKLGNRLKTVPVMKAWERPAANAHGAALGFANVPNGLNPDLSLEEMRQAVRESTFFIPMLGNAPADGARAFDLKGRTIGLDALGMDAFGAGALFQTVGDKTEQAAAALGALGTSDKTGEEKLQVLTAQWLEITLIAPGGEKHTMRRYVLDRIGKAARKAGSTTPAPMDDEDVTAALLGVDTLMVATGGFPAAFVTDRYLEQLLATRPVLESYVDFAYTGVEPDLGDVGVPPSPVDNLVLYSLFDAGASESPAIVYRSEPSVVSLRRGYGGPGTVALRTDVLANQRRALTVNGASIFSQPGAALAVGVWETASERVALKSAMPWEDGVSTFRVLAAAADQGIERKVLPAGSAAKAVTASVDARFHLAADLGNGFAAVVPARTPDGVAMTGWWRVDPTTGNTLGMTGDGRGQEATEYMLQLTDIAITLIGSLRSLAACDEETTTSAKICCLARAHFGNMVGLSLGGVIGASMGTGAAVVFGAGMTVASETGQGPDYQFVCDAMGDMTALDNW